jgi:uncharacterized protein (DUF362 family)
MSLVSSVENLENTVESIEKSILQSLELIDYSFSKVVKNVVIKVNMCYYWDYTTGHTTDPKFVAALINILRKKISPDVTINIIESDASAMKCKPAFKFLGYEKLAKKHRVNLVNLSEVEAEKITVTAGSESFDFMLPKIVKDADLRINLPKMKYMEASTISCALKNIYGCNPYPKKYKLHPKLSEAIVALNKIMNFDLIILDGLTVLGSHVSKLGLIMASQDPVAMDTALAKIMKVNPKSVKHIMLAEREGIGKASFTSKGMDINYFRDRYPQSNFSDKIVSFGYRAVCKLGLDKRLLI